MQMNFVQLVMLPFVFTPGKKLLAQYVVSTGKSLHAVNMAVILLTLGLLPVCDRRMAPARTL
jgi:hypothetical protein